MDDLPEDTISGVTTRYFVWDSEPARMHYKPNGDVSADVYRSGLGIVRVEPTAVYYGSHEISKARYKALVLEEIRHSHRAEQDEA